ncbi:MAG: excinuclease ABC subunit UvrC [Myxococcota bacterium]
MSAPGSAQPGPDLEERIRSLPMEPGVYLFEDASGHVLYVGKAQSLRARVRSYFQRGGDGRVRMAFLVPRIHDVRVIVTANVKEALLLENELIKKHRPRFNVRLRDDKSYLGLRLDPRLSHPRFSETRRFRSDGALYFGPYTSSRALRQTLGQLQRIFPLRTCTDSVMKSYRRRGRPCLEHSLGRCSAPCCERISTEAYSELVRGALLVLRGQSGTLLDELRGRMDEAAREERFEEAARLRDRIAAVERTLEGQSMVSSRFVDQDVFGLAREGSDLEVQILHVRGGKLLGGSAHGFRSVRIEDAEALASFLGQLYAGDRDLPRELLLPLAVEGVDALAELWRERVGYELRVYVPRRGERRRLVELARRNAALALAERGRRERRSEEVLSELQRLLRLSRWPGRIECYDVSHLQGALPVACRVVFSEGEPDKNGYRRYRLRATPPGDDYGAMRETLARRLARLSEDPAPDLILIDGGKGQLSAAAAVVKDLGLEGIALAALAKEREGEGGSRRVQRHGGAKREKLYRPAVKDPLRLPTDSTALLLLQRIRDESHRFALRYHRELRRKSNLRSILEELPGIGPVKRRALLRGLGSLEAVKGASPNELARLPGISRLDAERIHRFFKTADESSDPSTGGGSG